MNENDKIELDNAVITTTNNLMTMKDLVTAVSTCDDQGLVDNVRRFKLMMVRKSFTDIMTLMDAVDIIQSTLMDKIKTDIDIYPITTVLDILADMNKIIDRNLSIMQSILPRSDDLSAYIAASNNLTINNQTINLEGQSASSVEKITQIVESVILSLDKLVKSDDKE